uniref:Serine hydroxymethyltransferase n=1 Tax=Eufriesea mexicana TaxID=516756 RepID=A0A310SBM4_9HYME
MAMKDKRQRQQNRFELIASVKHLPPAVITLHGIILTKKYAEGYPGGNFHANVHLHSGSQASAEVYAAILISKLYARGHITNGHKINYSGNTYTGAYYGVRKKDEYPDYDEVFILLMNEGQVDGSIAARTQAFYAALSAAFKTYHMQVIKNAQALAYTSLDAKLYVGIRGTDNNLLTANVINFNG